MSISMSLPDYISDHNQYKKNIDASKIWYRQRSLEKVSKNNVVYILECAENTIYIGTAHSFENRYKQHTGELHGGSEFTKRYPPIRVIALIDVEYKDRYAVEDSILKNWKLAYPDKIICGGRGHNCRMTHIHP